MSSGIVALTQNGVLANNKKKANGSKQHNAYNQNSSKRYDRARASSQLASEAPNNNTIVLDHQQQLLHNSKKQQQRHNQTMLNSQTGSTLSNMKHNSVSGNTTANLASHIHGTTFLGPQTDSNVDRAICKELEQLLVQKQKQINQSTIKGSTVQIMEK